MAYTAADVKNLRERTGAGMMDCKKALDEAAGDFEAAVDALRAKGLAAAAKKSSRTAAEGLVGIAVSGTAGIAVEVNSETDFVAKNDQFQDFVRKTTEVALNGAITEVEALKAAAYPDGATVGDKLTSNVATIGENQQIRRIKAVKVGAGLVVPYMHNAAAPNLGKIGVLVALESDAAADVLEPLGKQIAMHIAAAFPLALNADDLDADLIARERKIAAEKAADRASPPKCRPRWSMAPWPSMPRRTLSCRSCSSWTTRTPFSRSWTPRARPPAPRLLWWTMSVSSWAKASRRKKPTSPPKWLPPPA
jgi:elongation factor Ts